MCVMLFRCVDFGDQRGRAWVQATHQSHKGSIYSGTVKTRNSHSLVSSVLVCQLAPPRGDLYKVRFVVFARRRAFAARLVACGRRVAQATSKYAVSFKGYPAPLGRPMQATGNAVYARVALPKSDFGELKIHVDNNTYLPYG